MIPTTPATRRIGVQASYLRDGGRNAVVDSVKCGLPTAVCINRHTRQGLELMCSGGSGEDNLRCRAVDKFITPHQHGEDQRDEVELHEHHPWCFWSATLEMY